jgi:hypothetical protein
MLRMGAPSPVATHYFVGRDGPGAPSRPRTDTKGIET